MYTPVGKAERISCVKICPYAQVTMQSAPIDFTAETSSLILANVNTGIPALCAKDFRGVGVSTALRPTGLSGWVITAAILKPDSISFFKGATENSGAPAYAIFMIIP